MSLMKKQNAEATPINRPEVAPASRVEETPDAYTLTVELPGCDEKDVELSVEHRTLTVAAENTVARHAGYGLTFAEIPEVRYRAVFELPERIDTAGIRASQRNGLLVLALPKHEEVKPRRIAITAG